MPSASAAPSESLGSLLKYYRGAGRMAATSAVGAGAAGAAVDAVVANYGRKRGMDRKLGDCVRIAERLGTVEHTNW